MLRGRQDFVLNACRGKRVLHLGCVDSGLTVERFQRGELMHQKLDQVAGELWGVDVDAEGIAFLRDHGFEHLLIADISSSDTRESQAEPDATMSLLQAQAFDVILATEVLEHLPNPANFLAAVQRLMTSGRTQFIVTVPNAFRVDTLLWMWRNVEYVHPDHNYWFSYATITALLRKAGFTVEEVYPYSFQSSQLLPGKVRRLFQPAGQRTGQAASVSANPAAALPTKSASSYFKTLPKRMLVAALYGRSPFWGDGLLVVATMNPHD
jgi:predicted TPR repeat methyltransferase